MWAYTRTTESEVATVSITSWRRNNGFVSQLMIQLDGMNETEIYCRIRKMPARIWQKTSLRPLRINFGYRYNEKRWYAGVAYNLSI